MNTRLPHRPHQSSPRRAEFETVTATEERILILAPTGSDARLTSQILCQIGLHPCACHDVDELASLVAAGCGAILMAEETFTIEPVDLLVEVLGRQPTWSDIPVVVITSGAEASQNRLRQQPKFGCIGNVSLIERPFRAETLISTLGVALRSRRRQYEVRNLMVALAEARSRIEATLEAADVGTWIWDLQTDRVVADKNMGRLFDLDVPGETTATVGRFLKRVHRDDRVRLKQSINSLLKSDCCELEVDYRIPQRNGTDRWVTARGKVERTLEGEAIRFSGVVIDITDRKQQQNSVASLARKIEEQARVFNITLSNISDFAYIIDREGQFLYANRPLLDFWGISLEQAVGKGFADLDYPPDLATKLHRQLQHVVATHEIVRDEAVMVSAAGAMEYYEYILTPVLDPGGAIEMVAGSSRNVTERKRHEATLAQLVAESTAQALRFDATLSSINDLAYTFDLEGNWIYANQPLLKLWGRTHEEIVGKSSLELGYPVELAERLKNQVFEVIRTRRPVRGETFYTSADGIEDYHEYIFSPVFGVDGEVSAVCGTTRLTTERKRAEAVAESQRRVLQQMAEDRPLSEVLDTLMRTVELECTTRTFASIFLLDADGVHLRVGAAPTLPLSFVKAVDGVEIGPAVGSSGTAAFTRQPVYVSDIAHDPLWAKYRELALSHGLRACWAIPVFSSQGEILGTFAIYHLDPREASDKDLRVVEMATRTAAIAIERKRNDLAIRESQRRYSQLVHALPTALYTTDAQGRITLYNEAAVVLWGRRPELGRDRWCGSWRMFRADGSALPHEQCPTALTIHQDRPVREPELIVERPDRTRRNVRSYPEPIRDASGRLVGAVVMQVDITENKLAEAASRHLAAIVESSDDAIISKDLEGRITSWNRGAERLFGYRAEEIIGRSVTELMPQDQLEDEPKILSHIRRGDRIEHYETIRRRKDGSLVEISLTISPIRDSGGKIVGASKIIRDISEKKLAERRLERAHQDAVAASKAKDEFLAALSHELRTPLNPVLLLASEAEQDQSLPASIRSLFMTIRNNVELEARLIDDLLDITRITHGKLSLSLLPLQASDVLREAIGTVSGEIQQKRLQLTLNLDETAAEVLGDAVRLQQIFWNVLKNAVKFTPQNGSITVSTTCEGPTWKVEIRDTGIGMTQEDLAMIFEAFTQGSHSVSGGSHRFGGLGLGLAISRRLVESHGGTITAHSNGPHQGSRFVITLPLATTAKKELLQARGGSSPLTPTSTTPQGPIAILVVEDHEPTRVTLNHLLTRRGFVVVTAASAAEARTQAASREFQILISDIGLPDGNGFDLMAELLVQNPSLLGIALTGYGMQHDVSRSQTAGFSVHLTKPVRIQSLDAALAGLIQRI